MCKSSEPLPWPAVVEPSVIHGVSLVAVHVQSRVVSTVTVAAAPPAGAVAIELVAVTWHFGPVGAVTSTFDDVHPAMSKEETKTANVNRMAGLRADLM